MQPHTEPNSLEVYIINGPGFRDLSRSSPLIARSDDPPLEWTMVTRSTRKYIRVSPPSHKTRDTNPLKFVGKIILLGTTERESRHPQGEFTKLWIVIEGRNADGYFYYYVGDYSIDTQRFGEGTIYNWEEFNRLSIMRRDPPQCLVDQRYSIVTEKVQTQGQL